MFWSFFRGVTKALLGIDRSALGDCRRRIWGLTQANVRIVRSEFGD